MHSFSIPVLGVALATSLLSLPAWAAVETFDNPVVLSPTQAPGKWYTDRYAPAGFTAPVDFDGDNRLQQSISAADSADLRPAGFGGGFYNTQGRKFDLAPGTTSLSIDLWVDSSWATTNERMAGLWGTAFNVTNGISFFPIVEFASIGNVGNFRGWNGTAGWVSMGLPTGFAYDSWYTLSISLNGANWDYKVGNLSLSVPNTSSTYIGNTILQGYNTKTGVTYDIYWDNLTAVPEPSTYGMVLAGLGVVAFAIRRRRSTAS